MQDVEQMVQDARAFVEDVWEDVVSDIDYLVQVESVEDTSCAQDGMPFGPGPHEALTRALALAQRLGLTTTNLDGYIGFGDLAGVDERHVATIGHVDIVPVGTGWDFDPLRVTRKGGYLLGRGVLDDKGPLVLSLYAAHYFARRQEAHAERPPLTLRCIVGCNEETGMQDVEQYLRHYPQPAFCFTPDACFPLICGEKGHATAAVASPAVPAPETRVVSLEGGTVSNAVPGQASALVRAACMPPSCDGIAVEEVEEGRLYRLRAQGIGGHASMPEGTRNAIGMLVCHLLDHNLCGEPERDFLEFERRLLADAHGTGIGVSTSDDAFGPLTCVGGTVGTEERDGQVRMRQTIDMRFPTSTTGGRLRNLVEATATEHGCELVDWDAVEPFYQSPDLPEVRVLVDTYNHVTGRDDAPITIGGGTYARHFDKAVAFGPDDPTCPAPSWVGQEHGPNEGVSEAELKRALVIYIVAIQRLMDVLA
ncbi:MAG: Sapep family Mn(2+)-dependent dipeptidase [Coriobacteriales bacterium]|nr:Sapep family Mn(2+)-dependent dipeptidase [Coriobacteriales bacterium]